MKTTIRLTSPDKLDELIAYLEAEKGLRWTISKSAKYKLAGNSIVVSCLYYIFKSMFIDEKPKKEPKQLTLFD